MTDLAKMTIDMVLELASKYEMFEQAKKEFWENYHKRYDVLSDANMTVVEKDAFFRELANCAENLNYRGLIKFDVRMLSDKLIDQIDELRDQIKDYPSWGVKNEQEA